MFSSSQHPNQNKFRVKRSYRTMIQQSGFISQPDYYGGKSFKYCSTNYEQDGDIMIPSSSSIVRRKAMQERVKSEIDKYKHEMSSIGMRQKYCPCSYNYDYTC